MQMLASNVALELDDQEQKRKRKVSPVVNDRECNEGKHYLILPIKQQLLISIVC